MFLYKNQFLLIFSFLSIPIELWESTAAIFQQSAGFVYFMRTGFFKMNVVRKQFWSCSFIETNQTNANSQ